MEETMTRIVKAFTILLASSAIAFSVAGNAEARGGGSGSLHGPGSSNNPIVYHPVHGPGSSHNPILADKPVVRDHRHHSGPHGGGPNGGAPSPEGGVTVTSGSGRDKVVVPTQVGNTVIAIPGNGLYNPPPPIVHDHR
jgi:hypothetical protein